MDQNPAPAPAAPKRPPRILSGVQPSGKLHLGNYFGAVKRHIEMQTQGQCFFFIANYHAMTTVAEAAKEMKRKAGDVLREYTRDVALDYLALGLDPEKAVFFRQSDVPEVTELAWVLATVTNMGLLERAHSYKDKTDKGITPSVGLFTYPILMAADILIYRSNLVPVGKDQVQHLEMTCDMAVKFNLAYGKVFPEPQAFIPEHEHQAKVPGVDGQKMSKSYGNTIEIFAEGKPLEKTVMSIKTDSTPKGQPLNPEADTVFALYRLFANADEQESLAAEYRAGAVGYGDAKKKLLAKIDEHFAPFRDKRKQLAADPATVEDVLRAGAAKARAEAQKTMDMVRKATGLA